MKDVWIQVRNAIIHFCYVYVLKRILFMFDPESVHDRFVLIGKILGTNRLTKNMTRLAFGYQADVLSQTVAGMTFVNPIGLAAGFDKNAEITDILPQVGFGFAEVGSITGEPCAGNAKPRLWRLPKSKSLAVYYGLKNDGCETIATRLRGKQFFFPVGISIAKTNSPDTCETDAGVADYVKAFRVMQETGDYYTINISCPNTYGGQPFTDAERLSKLLTALDKVTCSHPVFLKLSPDISRAELDKIIDLAAEHRVTGFICTNLTKDRERSEVKAKIFDSNIPTDGGLSGKVVEELSNDMIWYVYTKTEGRYPIIGCGGVFTAADAYKKILSGASLVQIITGMIYEGPQVISSINQGLKRLLKRDGYINISEAIGKRV